MQVLVPDVSSTNAVKFDGERNNSVNHYLSDSLILIKKLDSQVKNIKELSGKIELLTCYVQSQNKFLNDIISVVKSLVLEKSPYDWEAFVKGEKKCMLKLGNTQTLQETEEKFQPVDINCKVIGIEKQMIKFKCKNVEDKHHMFGQVKDNVSKNVPLLNLSMYNSGKSDEISGIGNNNYSSPTSPYRGSPYVSSSRPMGPIRAIFLNNQYSISVHQFERCFASVNFDFVNIDDVVIAMRAQNLIYIRISNKFYAEEKYILGGFPLGVMENMDEFMSTVGIDNNMHGKIVEVVVKSMRSELEILKNQIKAEMKEEMKMRHIIAMEEISKPRKVKLEYIEGDDDGPKPIRGQ
ncbi:hypothetical protein WN944_024608 [Citrus x changshan-huyou]|uniref:Uncharacterized protein n=1 Tax=Citrus x changshan-huyou TaxID=2935761 RepID=A0AAP0LNX3_9ROSI